MKASNSLKDLADTCKEKRDAAGYDLRVMATEADPGSHINPDATATTRQEHVDDHVGGGDKDQGWGGGPEEAEQEAALL